MAVETREVAAPNGTQVCVAELKGSLDAGTTGEFASAMEEMVAKGARCVVLDLTETKYINSTGLAMLLKYVDAIEKGGGRVVFASVPSKVTMVMQMLGFMAMFTVCPDLNAALNALAPSQTVPEPSEVSEPAPEGAPAPPPAPIATESAEAAEAATGPEGQVVDLNALLEGIPQAARDRLAVDIHRRRAETESFFEPLCSFDSGEDSKTLFVCLKAWSSHAPSEPPVPRISRVARGGGYLIRYRGKGICVDPDSGFLEGFRAMGGRLGDIDHILVTRAHSGHTGELERLLELLAQYNRRGAGGPRRVHLYLSTGAARRAQGVIATRGAPHLASVTTLNAGSRDIPHRLQLHRLPGAAVTVLRTFNEDETSRDASVGLGFSFSVPTGVRTAVFTGDTGLYPAKIRSDGNVARDGNGEAMLDLAPAKALYHQYPDEFQRPDLLVASLGPIQEYELQRLEESALSVQDLNASGEVPPTKWERSRVFNPNHLGLRGLVLLAARLRPTCVVVGECGSELQDTQLDLVHSISRALGARARAHGTAPLIVPSDLTIACDIGEGTVLCHATGRYEKPEILGCMKLAEDEASPFFSGEARRTYLFTQPLPAEEAAERMLKAFHDAVALVGLPRILCGSSDGAEGTAK